jgi:hypothetical protein
MNQQRNSVPCFEDAKWWGCFGDPEAVLGICICIRISRICLFLGFPDSHPDLFVSTDPDPIRILPSSSNNSKKNLDFYFFVAVTSFMTFYLLRMM